MEQTLSAFLKEKGYLKIPLKETFTNHLELKAHLNGIEGRFILDTGASSTCVGLDCVDHFKLFTEESEVKATGAGAGNLLTEISSNNIISIKGWMKKKLEIVVFDLTHVNQALTIHDALPVHGIIGADILKKGKAVIDYKKRKLYMKP